MSHIVPSYNKQYGCLWDICIRKGGALRKPCFDCILQRADYFFPGPPAFFRVRSVAFLCDFCFLLAKLFVGFLVDMLPVEDSCVLCNFSEFHCCWIQLCVRLQGGSLLYSSSLKLCGSIRLTILISKLSVFLQARLQVMLLKHSWNTFHYSVVSVIDTAAKVALRPRGPRLFVCLSKSHTSEIISVY